MSTLLELAERVQKLTKPCPEMDARIWCAVFAPPDAYVEQSPFNGVWCIYRPSIEPGKTRLWQASNSHVQPVTSSIDAALKLVPDGYAIERLSIWKGQPAECVITGTHLHNGEYWHTATDGRWQVECATPALAIIVGALRARAAL